MGSLTGGDIDGLRNLADNLRAYAADVRDLAGRLTAVARGLTEDDQDGWHGEAASAFTAAWRRQARAAAVLEDYAAAVGRVTGELAAELARIEAAAGAPPARQRAAFQANVARENAARTLATLHQRVSAPGTHPGDAMAAVLAGGLLVAPVSSLGRHAAGHIPEPAAADAEPEALKGVIGVAENVPLLDVAATVVGAGVGSYYDIEDGQSPATAIGDELISNGAGMAAANVGGGLAGAAIGTRLGAAGGPVGVAAGAVIGYGAGELTHNLLDEHWSADIDDHGVVDGTVHGAHHAADQTADDARELAVHTGHQVEHYWDGLFG